jgi:hypothetical protein
MSDNPDQNMKNEKCCSQLSPYFKTYVIQEGGGEGGGGGGEFM